MKYHITTRLSGTENTVGGLARLSTNLGGTSPPLSSVRYVYQMKMSFQFIKRIFKGIFDTLEAIHLFLQSVALFLIILFAVIAIPAELFLNYANIEHPYLATFALYLIVALVILFNVRKRRTHNQSIKADEK